MISQDGRANGWPATLFANSSVAEGPAIAHLCVKPYSMRKLHFGEAETELPDNWRSKLDRNGVTMAAPPNQNVAFLWLSSVSWETPDRPGFNPAEDFFASAPTPEPTRTEDTGDSILAQFVEEDARFETHTFRVLPKRPFGTRCASAILTLSIKRNGLGSPVAQDALQQTWEIVRKVRFSHDLPA